MATIKIRSKRLEDFTLVRMLIRHPMETGRRINPSTGNTIPAHYINRLTVRHRDKIIVSCDLGPGISMDPFFSFRIREAQAGDPITVTWIDNQGHSEHETAKIK